MGGPGLTIRHRAIEDRPDTALVTVEGSIGPMTIPRLKEDLQALVEDGTRRFILDCKGLSYINSGGMAYLIGLAGDIEPEGGTIGLAAVDPKIVVIFKMMGLMHLFKFYRSSAHALDELRGEEEPKSPHPQVSEEMEVVFVELPDPPAKARPKPQPVGAKVRTARRTMEVPPAPRGNPISRLLRRLFGPAV
jgi:anti-sigma B factor antagonist